MENKTILAVAVAVLLVVLSKLKSFLSAKPKLNLPPGPWTLPVIGSLHHLGTNPVIYRTMSVLAQKYGPLMLFQFGEIPLMVVSSPEAAQEVMKTHDTMFADRWVNPTLATLTYNKTDMVFSPHGERWGQLRKIFVLELLSAARVRSFRSIREEEVAWFVRNVAASTAMDLSQEISRFINDTFSRECVGSRCRHQDKYLLALHEAIHQTSGLSIADLFPSSRVMRMLGSAPRRAAQGARVPRQDPARPRGDHPGEDGSHGSRRQEHTGHPPHVLEGKQHGHHAHQRHHSRAHVCKDNYFGNLTFNFFPSGRRPALM
jgi:hypothetical protein